MNVQFNNGLLAILLLAVISACQPSSEVDIESTPEIIVRNGNNQDARIYLSEGDKILPFAEVTTSTENGRIQTEPAEDLNYVLVLRAQVDPPQWQNSKLQASHVTVANGLAYVAYNTQGSTFLGGLDIINVQNPRTATLVAQAIYPNTEFSSVAVDNRTIYLAGAKLDEDSLSSPAILEIMTYQDSLSSERKTVDVPGFVSTDVKVDENFIYVTHGSTGGLSVYNKTSLELVKTVPLDDARSLIVSDDQVTVMQGSPGRITTIQKNSWQILQTVTTDGANEPGAKSVFAMSDDTYFIPAGQEGLKLLNRPDGSLVQHITIPVIEDIEAANLTCNGVSYANDKVFAANGAAGMYVIHQVDNDFQLFGSVQFPASTNYVMSQGNLLFVATGTKGLQIVEIIEYDPEAGNYITIGDWNEYGRPNYLCETSTQIDPDIDARLSQQFIAGDDLTQRQPNWFLETVLTDIALLEDTDLEITVVGESTHHKNTIGYYTYPNNDRPESPNDLTDLTVLFPNATVTLSESHLMKGDKICLPGFSGGNTLGFFLNFKGFVDGEVTTGFLTHYSSWWLHKNRPIKQQNVILAIPEEQTLVLAYEDIQRDFHDQDFDDGIFLLKFSNPDAVNWSAFPELP
ncbi:hypothetical protein [Tunicatimonas pelagia]|uniref:hypothetical protein n=1 Tax=Tunicatimonas pelagia TaxID=931531 RepID=UPI0026653491|nr:hypothetical protein [Tunicatimonas pelagia]WKN42509.1 hypothetical protein P0M28_26080 [Tunicatimonas pelagia]